MRRSAFSSFLQAAPLKSSTRTRIVFFAKATLAIGLLFWLARSVHLDMDALKVLFERPTLLAMDLGLFAFGAFISALRFRVLLGLADVTISLRALFPLQMTAYFFNVVIPGNIGGDVVKALYVAREEPKEKRTTI